MGRLSEFEPRPVGSGLASGCTVPGSAQIRWRDPDAFITAGAKAVIGVIGVRNWRGRNDDGGLAMLPDWESVALTERRQVYVVYDSDIILKQPVAMAMNPSADVELLVRRGASGHHGRTRLRRGRAAPQA